MAKNNFKNRKSYSKEIREAESKPKKSKWRELIEDILLAVILYFAIDFCHPGSS